MGISRNANSCVPNGQVFIDCARLSSLRASTPLALLPRPRKRVPPSRRLEPAGRGRNRRPPPRRRPGPAGRAAAGAGGQEKRRWRGRTMLKDSPNMSAGPRGNCHRPHLPTSAACRRCPKIHWSSFNACVTVMITFCWLPLSTLIRTCWKRVKITPIATI